MEQDFFKAADSFIEAEPVASGVTEVTAEKEFNLADAILSYKRNGTVSVMGEAIKRVASTVKMFVERMISKIVHFAKEALEIAVSKFLVELCAMVIAAVCKALLSKHGKGMDITTGGVFWNGSPNTTTGPAAPNSHSNGQQGSMWSGSAFDSGWSRTPGGAW